MININVDLQLKLRIFYWVLTDQQTKISNYEQNLFLESKNYLLNKYALIASHNTEYLFSWQRAEIPYFFSDLVGRTEKYYINLNNNLINHLINNLINNSRWIFKSKVNYMVNFDNYTHQKWSACFYKLAKYIWVFYSTNFGVLINIL